MATQDTITTETIKTTATIELICKQTLPTLESSL